MLSFKSLLDIEIGMQKIRQNALTLGKVIYDDGDSMVIIPNEKGKKYFDVMSFYPQSMMEKKK